MTILRKRPTAKSVNPFNQNVGEEDHPTLTVNQNDYTPTNWATSYIHKISSDSSSRQITGFGALPNGTRRLLVNDGTFDWVIANNSASSSANNRVLCPGDENFIEFKPEGMVEIQYFSSDSRWRIIHPHVNELDS